MMHVYLMLAVLSVSATARAMPLLDRSAPAGPEIVIDPDHQDPHLYYVNPRTLRLARDEKGVPLFRYTEYWSRGAEPSKRAVIHFMVESAMLNAQVEVAMENVRRVDPAAKFAPVPILQSEIQIDAGLDRLIARGSCAHRAGTIGQLQQCTLYLTSSGRRRFMPSMKMGRIMPIQLEYSVPGARQTEDQRYVPYLARMAVSGFIQGEDLVNHPELFDRL